MHEGRFTEAVDPFANPFWDTVRTMVAEKAITMRRQGFFGAAMLPMSELEYTGIVDKLKQLEPRFQLRAVEKPLAA
jgi:fructose 1,6-bisphosphate aldolase/phosphatase